MLDFYQSMNCCENCAYIDVLFQFSIVLHCTYSGRLCTIYELKQNSRQDSHLQLQGGALGA